MSSRELRVRNILNVLQEAGFADAHWELLGQQLMIKQPNLLTIRANRNHQANFCMIDTISQWLNNDTEASWEKLADAVAKVQGYGKANADIVRREAGIDVSNGQPPKRDQSKGKRTTKAGTPRKRVKEDSSGEEDEERSEQEEEAEIEMPKCLTYTREDEEAIAETTSSSFQSAFIPDTRKLLTIPEIKVWFMSPIPNWRYGAHPITDQKILEWANEWNTFHTPKYPDGNPVPKFVPAKSQADSDVRVEYTVNGDSRSQVGTDAKKIPVKEATMYLDLGRGHDEYKQYLVLHEFGHVLGLGHEHQSPKALDFIDKTKAIGELTDDYKKALKNTYHGRKLDKMAKKEAENKFEKDFEQKSGGEATEYDPHSIMHYWIPKKWLKKEYEYIASRPESQLSEQEKGIKKRLTTLATKLSDLDKEMIADKYQEVKNAQPQEKAQITDETPEVAAPRPPGRTVIDYDEPSTSFCQTCIWISAGVVLLLAIVSAIVWGPGLLTPAQPPADNNCHRITRKQDLPTELAEIGNWEALCSQLEVPEATLDGLVHAHLENTAKKQRCL